MAYTKRRHGGSRTRGRARSQPQKAWPRPARDEVLTAPLGGIGLIGMNMTCYGHDGKWIIVDAGISFADEDETPGIQSFMPDPAFIEERLEDVVGMIVTHAHEDHIGAIQHLWPRLRCPIHATPFAARLIRGRLEEAGKRNLVKIKDMEVGSTLQLGPFAITSVAMAHSVPEATLLAIRTKAGTVVHTGDWKFDPAPVVGPKSDEAALRRIGDEGVLALVCDSTNAHVPGHTGSEEDVLKSLRAILSSRKGTVAVACFASNVARLTAVALAAKESGRKVVLAGRSLLRMEEIARFRGLLKGLPRFISEEEAEQLPARQVAIVCTGSQGEERAVLARIARGQMRRLRLDAGDTVVLSARAIPGNEEGIEEVTSRLKARDIEVITTADAPPGMPIHVSGHPAQDDLARMYALVRPQILMPVHGTDQHLEAHAAFGAACGIARTHIPMLGTIIRFSADGATAVGRVPTGVLAFDGKRVIPWPPAPVPLAVITPPAPRRRAPRAPVLQAAE